MGCRMGLHGWGFHEAKLDSKAVKLRLPSVERMTLEAQKSMGRSNKAFHQSIQLKVEFIFV
jgi:hypothetical protein